MRKPWTSRPDTPEWVSAFTDIGRPLGAVVVLVLCAPGEQHIAQLAGWSYELSWGMAGLLAFYAGLAAVVATNRPKGAPGKKSAVVGAILALLLAMAAQPIAHLFMTGWLSATPRAPWELVVAVSPVPPLVLGHLLHLAAHPDSLRRDVRAMVGQVDNIPDNRTDKISADSVSAQDSAPVRTDILADNGQDTGQPDSIPAPRPEVVRDPGRHRREAVRSAGHSRTTVSAPVPDIAPDTDNEGAGHPDTRTDSAPDNVLPIRRTGRTAGQPDSLSGFVKELWDQGMSRPDIITAVRDRFPDAKPDTVSKAVRRAKTA